MVTFNGTYVNEKSENVDEYMAATGMPWIARKAAGSASINLGELRVFIKTSDMTCHFN